MKLLVTGGAGYIGSHFVKMALDKGYDVTVFDNLTRGHREAVPENVNFELVDLTEASELEKALSKYQFDAVVHFAAFAYVGESVENPVVYYSNNVFGSLNLIKSVINENINKFVFSSTCSIYGNPKSTPITEEAVPGPINPYAKTKLVIEQILKDFEKAYGLKYVSLRYFNAAGADPGGKTGESHDPEPHLIPLVLKTALKERETIYVYGDDYETTDGTCIRDFIHVNDLVYAHLKELELLNDQKTSEIINLGTGQGNSVKEIITKAEEITERSINYEITGRREGDPAVLVADNSKAKKLLNWEPEFTLKNIIESAWKWHKNQRY